ncbi:hypothetical protein HYW67_03995 [Candidatus Parcubacteria bacterium]|nr:hypothetical protein [Candidatus Parcubacteria bacterium]
MRPAHFVRGALVINLRSKLAAVMIAHTTSPNVEPRRRESAAPHISVAGRNPAPKADAPTIHPPAGADGLLVRWVNAIQRASSAI